MPVHSDAPPLEEGDEDRWAGLMARAQDGDNTAYRRLLTEIAPYLRSLARRYHREGSDVEDSLQDILLCVHSIRHTYDPERPFKPWLVAIGKRRIIDRLRVQRRHRARETELGEEHETFAAPETNTQQAQSEAGSEAAMLRAAIGRLPEGQRQAVTLLKLQEMSLKEAADASGMSIAALKVATHRAVKSLRSLMEPKDRER